MRWKRLEPGTIPFFSPCLAVRCKPSPLEAVRGFPLPSRLFFQRHELYLAELLIRNRNSVRERNYYIRNVLAIPFGVIVINFSE